MSCPCNRGVLFIQVVLQKICKEVGKFCKMLFVEEKSDVCRHGALRCSNL